MAWIDETSNAVQLNGFFGKTFFYNLFSQSAPLSGSKVVLCPRSTINQNPEWGDTPNSAEAASILLSLSRKKSEDWIAANIWNISTGFFEVMVEFLTGYFPVWTYGRRTARLKYNFLQVKI